MFRRLAYYLHQNYCKKYSGCDKCQEDWQHHCSNCGPLVIIKDNPAEKGDPCYAKKTLPDKLLQIRKSRIHGLGVFAKSIVKARLRFGPYKGKSVELEEKEELDASYTFEVNISYPEMDSTKTFRRKIEISQCTLTVSIGYFSTPDEGQFKEFFEFEMTCN